MVFPAGLNKYLNIIKDFDSLKLGDEFKIVEPDGSEPDNNIYVATSEIFKVDGVSSINVRLA
jgi:hypothetical protein